MYKPDAKPQGSSLLPLPERWMKEKGALRLAGLQWRNVGRLPFQRREMKGERTGTGKGILVDDQILT
jgi:hypothetical protein